MGDTKLTLYTHLADLKKIKEELESERNELTAKLADITEKLNQETITW
jgi:hypothetical protein